MTGYRRSAERVDIGTDSVEAGASSPLSVLVAMSVPGPAGGIYAAERPFRDALGRKQGVVVATIPFGRRSDEEAKVGKVIGRFADLVRFGRTLARFKPDVVHLNSSFDQRALVRDIGYLAIARVSRRPVLLKLHGSDRELIGTRSPLKRLLARAVLAGATVIAVLSTEERRLFESAHRKISGRIVVLPNAVDPAPFLPNAPPPAPPFELLFVGRFIATKGLLESIEAVRLLLDAGCDVRLTCLGRGPLEHEARELAATLGVADVVIFPGWATEDEVVRSYARAFALVLPTRREGFPMAVFQAVAAGVPIVTTRIRASADYLTEPANCLWIDANDPKNIAERIAELASDPRLRAEMSRRNVELARRFSPEAVASLYLETYRAMLTGERVR